MKLVRGIHNLKDCHRKCVLTIGNFDGVHRGHQALLRRLCEEGKKRHLPIMVMLFEPQPLELFRNENAPARLSRLRDKLNYLSLAGVNIVCCVSFNRRFASLTAGDFIYELLINKLSLSLLVVGDDFRFGADREGDFRLLQQAGTKYGFDVVSTDTFCDGEQRISSTAIREALVNDNLPQAKSLLGHSFHLSGRVIHGDARGRMLGFPTANISLSGITLPVRGVYIVAVYGLGEKYFPAVANIGTRPTVAGQKQLLEVHLLDVSMDLYGKHLCVVFYQKIRSEQRFADLDALKTQIKKDVCIARDFFKRNDFSTTIG